MDRLPDIEMPAENTIMEDLKIIEAEDLSADPFERAPPFKPEAPKPEKPKRQVSEKQKAHLANARKLARERKAQQKKEALKEQRPLKEPEIEPVKVEEDKKDDFEKFLGYMDKYADMVAKVQEQERIKKEELAKKEKEREAYYFKKFQEQQQLKEKSKPLAVKKIPKNNLDILRPPVNDDFGEYSNYF